MAKVLEMPKLSPTMEEGQISAWHKNEGDAIAVDDLLAEVETDKATMEYRSFDKGTLLKILAPAGSVVKLGQPVAILGDKGEDVSNVAPSGTIPPKTAPTPTEKSPPKPVEKEAPKAPEAPHEAQAETSSERVKASPYVRKLARERDVD